MGDSIIRRMRFAGWITKTKKTHTEYVIFITFPTAAVVSPLRISVTLYIHCLSCLYLCMKLHTKINNVLRFEGESGNAVLFKY
jgi:hypothetical protein